jgi:hypothetical protein
MECETTAANKIEVDIRATQGEDGSVEFQCMWRPDSGSVWYSGPIDLPKGSGEHDLEITLDDRSGRDLQFYDKAGDAMWVNIGSCPEKGVPHADKGQIRDKTVVAGKKKLTLKDINEEACRLLYALRFEGDHWTDPAGKSYPPYEYDPEIKNGGKV